MHQVALVVQGDKPASKREVDAAVVLPAPKIKRCGSTKMQSLDPKHLQAGGFLHLQSKIAPVAH